LGRHQWLWSKLDACDWAIQSVLGLAFGLHLQVIVFLFFTIYIFRRRQFIRLFAAPTIIAPRCSFGCARNTCLYVYISIIEIIITYHCHLPHITQHSCFQTARVPPCHHQHTLCYVFLLRITSHQRKYGRTSAFLVTLRKSSRAHTTRRTSHARVPLMPPLRSHSVAQKGGQRHNVQTNGGTATRNQFLHNFDVHEVTSQSASTMAAITTRESFHAWGALCCCTSHSVN
jgi:hypothetical protein